MKKVFSLVLVAASLSLVACGGGNHDAEDTKETMDQALEDAVDATEEAAEAVEETVEEAADSVEAAVEEVTDEHEGHDHESH